MTLCPCNRGFIPAGQTECRLCREDAIRRVSRDERYLAESSRLRTVSTPLKYLTDKQIENKERRKSL